MRLVVLLWRANTPHWLSALQPCSNQDVTVSFLEPNESVPKMAESPTPVVKIRNEKASLGTEWII